MKKCLILNERTNTELLELLWKAGFDPLFWPGPIEDLIHGINQESTLPQIMDIAERMFNVVEGVSEDVAILLPVGDSLLHFCLGAKSRERHSSLSSVGLLPGVQWVCLLDDGSIHKLN